MTWEYVLKATARLKNQVRSSWASPMAFRGMQRLTVVLERACNKTRDLCTLQQDSCSEVGQAYKLAVTLLAFAQTAMRAAALTSYGS